MRIAIIGAGFTGLTAAYELTKHSHKVVIFEKDDFAGGLASGVRHVVDDYPDDWDWDLERFYHHWFTNDEAVMGLIKELGVEGRLIVKRPITATWYRGQAYQLDSPSSLLFFSPLSLFSRLRIGAALAYLKYAIGPKQTNRFENVTADAWVKRWMGDEAHHILWQPLLKGKFDHYYDQINMTWFWARIFKRTPRLAYFRGGFGALVDTLVEKIREQGGTVLLNQNISAINQESGGWKIEASQEARSLKLEESSSQHPASTPASNFDLQASYDRVILTTPPSVLTKLFPNLTNDHPDYATQLTSQKGIGAFVLILVLDRPLLSDNIYWLNINEEGWPFLAVVEHTNFVDPSRYGGKHIIYIGDYLPADHPRMQMAKQELLKEFEPYLAQLNPKSKNYKITKLQNSWLFRELYAQPVVGLNHAEKILPLTTPIPNIYLASMAQVYPWDRGTNYAMELGQKVAQEITNSK